MRIGNRERRVWRARYLLIFEAPRGLVQPCLVALCKKSTRNQPSCRNTHGWNDVWFKGNQPCSNPHIGKPTVLRKPTPFQPSYLKAHGWNDGWFHENQPLVVLYVGRNTIGFLSIFCTNQPVGIRLVDSWTSPRGR